MNLPHLDLFHLDLFHLDYLLKIENVSATLLGSSSPINLEYFGLRAESMTLNLVFQHVFYDQYDYTVYQGFPPIENNEAL